MIVKRVVKRKDSIEKGKTYSSDKSSEQY